MKAWLDSYHTLQKVVLFWFLLFCPLSALCQHGDPLDVSKCFSDILVDKRVDWKHERLKYAMLSAWNRDLFNAAQSGGSLDVLIEGLPVGASFEQSDEMRIKELLEQKESIDYDSATASSVAWLDTQAGQIIHDCLDAQIRKSYGLYAVEYLDDDRHATVVLNWNWLPSGTPILIKTKNILNGKVTDDQGKHPSQLLPGRYMGLSDWGELSRSTPISLERIDLNKDIVINLESDPDVGLQHIVVPVVPEKQDCKPATETADQFGAPYEATVSSLAELLPIVSDDGAGHKYVNMTLDISTLKNGKDGVIDAVGCRKSSPTLYAEIINPIGEHIGSVATCHGWFQNRGSTFEMHVVWHKTGYKCTPIPRQ